MKGRHQSCYKEHMLLDSEDAPGGVVVYYADGDEEIVHVNTYVLDLFECDNVEEFLELVGGSFRGFVHDDDLDSAEDSIWGQVEKHGSLDHINYRIKTKTGKLVNVEDFGRLVKKMDGRPVFHVLVVAAEQRGAVDWLTGLPSMARFHELAEMAADTIRSRGDRPVAIALDLVGMKSFNAQYGREVGDNLLCAFADVLRNHFGSEACSRFSEDHFYAFAPYEGVSEKIEALFAEFKDANDGRVLPIRAGSYVCEDDDDIISIGFDHAKIACDQDRKTWQSHNMWFDDDMRSAVQLRIHILDQVDQAIAEGWIRPYYQAFVRASTGSVCGEEALARWIDPTYGTLYPDQFIPVLEEAGLLHKVDMHIIDCVLSDFAAKLAQGMPVVPVSVNISLRDLGKIDVVKKLTEKADAAHLPHSLLKVEFTESAALDDTGFFTGQVKALRDAGFRVCLDDFGSGYSSLNMMQEYEFDIIKLDIEFINDIDNPASREIIAGVVHVAKKLGVATLAEGVETEEQAVFLESIGCDMLQGFYYTKPISIDGVIAHFERADFPLENPEESAYWSAVGAIDLFEPLADSDGRAVDGSPISDFPAGVMEYRNGVWNLLRANWSYRDFLKDAGVLPADASSLRINPMKRQIDDDYVPAARRSSDSGSWERIAGRMEYGSGLRFYIKPIAESDEAQAYALAALPTMLGAALGSYGDVPVAYAVCRVILDKTKGKPVDVEYVYANPIYHEWGHHAPDSLTAKLYSEVNGYTDAEWFPHAYRAVMLGKSGRGTMYSKKAGHWLNFRVAPSPMRGCCVVAFMIADEERREREEIIVGRDTSDLIVRIVDAFSSERGYTAAMDGVLEIISQAIHPKRLFIFERGDDTNWVTFEWCASDADRQVDSLEQANVDHYGAWDSFASNDKVIYIPDISMLEPVDEGLYRKLAREGITHMLAAPLFDGETVIGNLVAENYEFEKGIDAKRLLETAAPFISSSIVNQRLMTKLELAGTHDYLTGLFNRRGFDQAISERLSAAPEEPFVLALMDIDNFKTVNDLYGHDVGDAALKALADVVRTVVPQGAILGRNGGDELVAMLFGEDALSADSIFEELSGYEKSCEHDGKSYRLTMSIGYVGFPHEAASLKDAYSKADAALYAVKLAGKSGYKRYSPEIETQYRSQLGFTPRDIAEYVPGAILVHKVGGEGDIMFANDELVEMFECDSLADFMEYTGGVFARIVHPDDRDRVYDELVGQVGLDEVGAKNFADYRIITKSGNVKHVSDNGRLVEIDGKGKAFYVLLIDRDERDERLGPR